MITINNSTEQFLLNVARIEKRSQDLQNQVSSGVRVAMASDAPESVGMILDLQSSAARNVQSLANLDAYGTEIQQGSTALQSAVDILQQARTIATQAASDPLQMVKRVSLAEMVKSLLERMVGVTRSSIESRFIFSGGKDKSAPYKLDLSAPRGVARLVEMTASPEVLDPTGVPLPAALNAQQIFDPETGTGQAAPYNAFAALNRLRTSLENNDSQGISASIDSLGAAFDYVNEQLAYYGVAQQRILAASDLAHSYGVTLQKALSNVRDADVAAAAVELTQAKASQEAAMQAEGGRLTSTLFDYLR